MRINNLKREITDEQQDRTKPNIFRDISRSECTVIGNQVEMNLQKSVLAILLHPTVKHMLII